MLRHDITLICRCDQSLEFVGDINDKIEDEVAEVKLIWRSTETMAAVEAGRRLHILHVTLTRLDYSRLVLRLGLALARNSIRTFTQREIRDRFDCSTNQHPITSTSIVRAIPRIAPGTRDNVCILVLRT